MNEDDLREKNARRLDARIEELTRRRRKSPTVLLSAEELARRTRVRLDRIVDLTESGYLPHMIIDGGDPTYELAECKKWIEENLTLRKRGRALPVNICIVGDTLVQPCDRPFALRNLPDLFDITDAVSEHSGIYFLCLGNSVEYVGQSKKVVFRLRAHVGQKKFDRILFMHWPAGDLDRMEGALIRHLKPKQNSSHAAPGVKAEDEEAIGHLGKIAFGNMLRKKFVAREGHLEALKSTPNGGERGI